MPLNPMENMPASFTRNNFIVDNSFEMFNMLKMNEQLTERKAGDNMKVASTENRDYTGKHYISPSTNDIPEELRLNEVSGS